MITLAGSSLGALSPWFLLAIPLATTALVYLFRSRGPAHPRVTSTLLLIASLPQFLPARRRFLPPLQFWLELLACLFLALAASGLFITRHGERIAIIVDNSKSMGTLHSATETRLNTALRIAEADISSKSSSSTRFTVRGSQESINATRASSSSQEVVTHSVSGSRARQALRLIEQSYTHDQLQAQVQAAINSREYDAVWVYTDKELASEAPINTLKVTTIPSDVSNLSNAWIESVSLRSPTQADTTQATHLEVRVATIGKPTHEIALTARCSDLQSGSDFTLGPIQRTVQSSNPTLVSLGPIERAWSFCQVSLAFSATSNLSDALSLDNQAWIAHSPQSIAIELYSSLSPQELGLQALPYTIVAATSDARQTGRAGVIFHRSLPVAPQASTTPRAPLEPTLVVYPAPGSSLWSQGRVSEAPRKALEVTRWESSHPILQYLRPSLLTIPSAVVLTCPDTATPILFTSSGPIVCAGEEAGVRYTIVGFELFPFDGIRSPTVSILTLNVLRWLYSLPSSAGDAPATSGSATTSSAALRGAGQLRIPAHATSVSMLAPSEATLSLPNAEASSAKSSVITLPSPGIFRIESTEQPTTLIAHNTFSTDESDISKTLPLSFQPPSVLDPQSTQASAVPQSNPDQISCERVLAWLALVVLVLDLVRRFISRARWGGTT